MVVLLLLLLDYSSDLSVGAYLWFCSVSTVRDYDYHLVGWVLQLYSPVVVDWQEILVLLWYWYRVH